MDFVGYLSPDYKNARYNDQDINLMYWKLVNTKSSYCVSVIVLYKIWWA
jgi:hypothetical protein